MRQMRMGLMPMRNPVLWWSSLIGRPKGTVCRPWAQGPERVALLAPLETTCEEIFAAGFLIERLLAPRPVPGAVTIDRQEYERLTREPRGFIAFRLRPRT